MQRIPLVVICNKRTGEPVRSCAGILAFDAEDKTAQSWLKEGAELRSATMLLPDSADVQGAQPVRLPDGRFA